MHPAPRTDAPARTPTRAARGCNRRMESQTGLIVFLVVVALVVVAIMLFLRARRRRRELVLAEARSEVVPYLDRLAADVRTIDPDGNRVAQQAMRDAQERLASTNNQLA